MPRWKQIAVPGLTTLASLANLGLGWSSDVPACLAAGSAGLTYVTLQAGWRAGRRARAANAAGGIVCHPPRRRAAADPNDPEAFVEQLLDQGRYALLLRPQIASSLNESQTSRAVAALEEGMGLVPAGAVILGEDAGDEQPRQQRERAPGERVFHVEQYFLDRHPVTNRAYYEFVVAGGYEQMSLWDEPIWPAVLDFVDRTGAPGPRGWQHGCYPEGRGEHPVVGVSWHEAVAYARWVGKRLPTDPEWVKAGAWPVTLSATTPTQRRYPWGDVMDRSRANLWGTGAGDTVPVDRYPTGVSVGGIHQLIGNVWEWTNGQFRDFDDDEEARFSRSPMRSLRGGAFDTYFDAQATCQFQSGDQPLARKPNIGFRCALGVCDLAMALLLGRSVAEEPQQSDDGEEVSA